MVCGCVVVCVQYVVYFWLMVINFCCCLVLVCWLSKGFVSVVGVGCWCLFVCCWLLFVGLCLLVVVCVDELVW